MTQWQNFFNQDILQEYQPQPKSLIDENGNSLIQPNYFNEALISPILKNNLVDEIIHLNKIIALDTEIEITDEDTILINKNRQLIQENKFNSIETRGLYGFELPGGYIVMLGGHHRLIAMFLEGVSETKIQINKINDPREYNFTGYFSELEVQKAITNGQIKAKVQEVENHVKKLILEQPLSNPLQLFGGSVSADLIDVLAQTLPID